MTLVFPKPYRSGSVPLRVVFAVLIILLGIFLSWHATRPQQVPQQNGLRPLDPLPIGGLSAAEAAYQLSSAALAASEEMQPAVAAARWQQLLELQPEDPDAVPNLAIGYVLWLRELSRRITDPNLSDADRQRAEQEFEAVIDAAREAQQQAARNPQKPELGDWLAAAIQQQQIERLLVEQQPPARLQLWQQLAAASLESTRPLILVGPLIKLTQRIQGPGRQLPDTLAPRYVDVLTHASDQHPRNLFVAVEALIQLLQTKDRQALGLARRVATAAAPLEGLLVQFAVADEAFVQRQITTILTAIDEGRWNDTLTPALQIRNVLTSTEVMRTDRRRADPHPLDLLSFDGLRRWSALISQAASIPPSEQAITFTLDSETLPDQVTAFAVADITLDGNAELLVVRKQELLVFQRDKDQWQLSLQQPIAAETSGVLVTDLFMVDASDASRLQKPFVVAEDAPASEDAVPRHDTFPCIVLYGGKGVQVFRFDGRQNTNHPPRLLTPTTPTGMEGIRDVLAVAVGDIDADGDLDLVVATETDGVQLWINRGNLTFFEVSRFSENIPTDDPITAMAVGDIDRDLDLDIVLTHGKSGRIAVLENLLHMQFRWVPWDEIPTLVKPSFVQMQELDGDVSWDLVLGGDSGVTLVFTNTIQAGQVQVDRIETLDQPGTAGVLADFNNDSWWNWLAIGPTAARAYRFGPWGVRQVELQGELPLDSNQLWAGDLNGDGLADLVGIAAGQLWTATNVTANTGHFLTVQFVGKDDNDERSGRVNHFGIGTVMEVRFGSHYRAQAMTQPQVHFGLGAQQHVDVLRAVLPNGITQNTLRPAVDTVVHEQQSLKGSCPYLYSWDGQQFAFVTDCLWAAPLGLQIAAGRVAPDRPWEYLKVPGQLVAPRDGHYELRITEELWEVAYIDHVTLLAVDHPADVEIFTNEKVGPSQIAQPTIFAFSPDSLRPVQTAVDTNGRDVTDLLREEDQRFVQGFDYRLRQGLCPPHWIDLDLGPVRESERVLLVLTGWILPTDTSLNIQIDQNPDLAAVEPPSVWVPVDGSWQLEIPFMGFPGGKTKTIVVDLTGHVRPEDPRVRIRTSAQIYWDRAAVAIDPPTDDLITRDCPLVSADLDWHGFSKALKPSPDQPEIYDYQQTDANPRWPPLNGQATAYGDVMPLLTERDDLMVVMAGGDEIRLRFSGASEPIPAGWKRDFILHCVGWDKDADLNTLTGQQFGPLPFQAMHRYPPPYYQFDNAAQVLRRNAHHLTRQQAFRHFWGRAAYRPKRFQHLLPTKDPP